MKDCLIIGFGTAMGYKDVYPLLKDRVFKMGLHQVCWDNISRGFWYTTLNPRIPEEKKLGLTKNYNEKDYPRFDNYDAIECKSKDIPVDYYDLIAVPISFFRYYDYLPYEILEKRGDLVLNGKRLFERLIIRRKN